MPWNFQEYQEFVETFYRHPEWRAQLRQLILTEELLRIPVSVEELKVAQELTQQSIRELAEAQKKSEERLTRLEQTVAELTEAQKKSEERLTRLEQTVAELAEAQKRTEQEVRTLAESLVRVEQRVHSLSDQLAEVRGYMIESHYRQRAFSYFGRVATRVKVRDLQEILPDIEPHLNEKEYEDLLNLDILVSAHLRESWAKRIGESQIWLAVEVSATVYPEDVERARRRADLLSRANLKVVPVAAGKGWTAEAFLAASREGVVLQSDGRLELFEKALGRLAAKDEV
ncbi:MAG: hypothetical protein ACK4VW_00665 [Anaerolineales bacterium]